MKKVLMKNRTSSNAIARMVLRRKLESDSGKQIDRSGGGIVDRRLLAYDPSAAPDIRTLLSNCVVVMVGCYVMFIAKDEEHAQSNEFWRWKERRECRAPSTVNSNRKSQ